MIEVRNLTKKYRELTVIDNFSHSFDEGKVYEYAFDTRLTSDWMREIGGYIRQPKANCECFTQFLSIYGGAVQQILGIVMDVNEMRQGLDHMEIEQYITQEVPRFKEAMARSRNNQKFGAVDSFSNRGQRPIGKKRRRHHDKSIGRRQNALAQSKAVEQILDFLV